MRRSLPLFLLFAFGCAHAPDVLPAPRLSEDPVELFRRARFFELAKLEDAEARSWVSRIRKQGAAQLSDLAGWNARVAYRKGEVAAALASASKLDPTDQTRQVITALLDHVDPTQPLRASRRTRDLIELPLDRYALVLGYPVVEMRVEGRRFNMLWDTGATENVFRPEIADELDLVRTKVLYEVKREGQSFVARFAASGIRTAELDPGWQVLNTPFLITDLERVNGLFKEETKTLDGFLSPQLLVPDGCFSIDADRAILTVAFGRAACSQVMASTIGRGPLFTWNGEVYASARIHGSPELGVQLETGSPVTFLRSDATRWLPDGTLRQTSDGAEIAHELDGKIRFAVAGREAELGVIDLIPSRPGIGHDDIATLGTDLLLTGRGFAVSFATLEIGFLEPGRGAVAERR